MRVLERRIPYETAKNNLFQKKDLCPAFEDIMEQTRSLKQDILIAGSSVLWSLDEFEYDPGDIDIYCYEDDKKKITHFLSQKGWFPPPASYNKSTKRTNLYKQGYPPIQFLPASNNMEDFLFPVRGSLGECILSSFDISISQCGIEKHNGEWFLFRTPLFERSIAHNTIYLWNMWCPPSTLARVFKYIERGYTIRYEEMDELVAMGSLLSCQNDITLEIQDRDPKTEDGTFYGADLNKIESSRKKEARS